MFLTGESYAGKLAILLISIPKAGYRNYLFVRFKKLHVSGHYVPQLAKLMIEMNTRKKIFNLKGIAVSGINQCLSYLSYILLFGIC